MVKVLNVVNGNTLRVELRGEDVPVRLLGVATPDPNDQARPILQRLGTEAMAFLKEFTKPGWVMVEFPSGEPVRDKDGVIDASVYCGPEATFLNEKLIGEGFGIVNRKVECPFRNQLLLAEKAAKGAQLGIWGSFKGGNGEKVASGNTHHTSYLGEVPKGTDDVNVVVYYWVVTYE